MIILLYGALILAGIYLSWYVAYWLILLGTHFFTAVRPTKQGSLSTRFAILVPAHNEEMFLPRLLASTRNQDYLTELFDTVVVADNCTDGTADIGRNQGATVLVRTDEEKLGKGHAISWALKTIDMNRYDVILIVDADCFISTNTLQSLDGAMQDEKVIQCYSGVANPDASWFTRLLDVSRTINNKIYSPAKQRIGLSSELTGTGMCFSAEILRKYGWDAFTVGEDWEYYAKLIQQGETVGFNGDAKVFHEESSSLKQATSQRMRWSSGRFAVAGGYGLRLLFKGLLQRSLVKIDAGLCLILPNPSLGMNITLLCLGVALLSTAGHLTALSLWFLLLASVQFGIFIIGVFYTKNRLSKFLAIFIAPAFLAWKMGIDALSILGIGTKKWVRTERKL